MAPDAGALDACLPAALRGPTTTITTIARGLSGAGVYRVDAGERTYVLKVSTAAASLDDWRAALALWRSAADAGVAPAVVHADESRRAVVSAFVEDRSFASFYRDPRTHAAAIAQLGATVRRLHALPLPGWATPTDVRAYAAAIWAPVEADAAVPPFAADAVRRAIAAQPPDADHAPVLCHNDLNPSNLVYDGARILFLDWETAWANDPYVDLAALALFLRMDDATCARLLAAYHGRAPAEGPLPARLVYMRRLVAAITGTITLSLARRGGHPGAAGGESLDATPTLGEVYGRLTSGALSLGTPDGQWAFGLALLKESATT